MSGGVNGFHDCFMQLHLLSSTRRALSGALPTSNTEWKWLRYSTLMPLVKVIAPLHTVITVLTVKRLPHKGPQDRTCYPTKRKREGLTMPTSGDQALDVLSMAAAAVLQT